MNNQNRDYIIHCTHDITGKSWKPQIRRTMNGVSKLANQYYRKYSEQITVTVGYFDEKAQYIPVTTYHA